VPLLELGSGFDLEYTGRENIYLKGALLGYSKSFLDDKIDEIIEFSELEEFIDVPLKNYSTGMSARLAFSIATMVNPQIMILDEVLSVGDAKFQAKSQERMRSLLNEYVTVLFVSHSTKSVRDICNNAIWLEHGRMVMQGPVDVVCDRYEEWIKTKANIIVTKSDPAKDEIEVPVDKSIEITFNEAIKAGNDAIELLSSDGEKIPIIKAIKDNILSINPVPLNNGTIYTLNLKEGSIKDLKGNPLNSTYTTTFTTKKLEED